MARVTVTYAATNAALRSYRRALPGFVQKGARRHGKFAVRFLRKERFMAYPGPESEDRKRSKLYRRLGKLQKSIRFDDAGERGSGIVVSAGHGLPDNRAVENEEGFVRVGNPHVEVPLPDNLTPRTGQRKIKTVAEALAQGGFEKLSRAGNPVIFKRRGTKNRGKLEALFVLMGKTFTKSRFNFEETLRTDRHLVKNRRQHITNAVRQCISEKYGRLKR